jgi:hypothetical protein
MDPNFPCKCGHEYWIHKHKKKDLDVMQLVMFGDTDKFCNFCICNNFQSDNLKYLEKQYKSDL